MDPLDQLLNLRSHHREELDWPVIDRGEGVRRACGHHMQSTRFNAVSLVTVLSVQPSAEDIERLVTSMVDAEARLVTGIRVLASTRRTTKLDIPDT